MAGGLPCQNKTMFDVQEFFAWYLAPWRRMGRGPFNVVVGVVTAVPLLLSLAGAGEYVGMGAHALDAIQQVQGGDLSKVPDVANLLSGNGAPQEATGLPWGDMLEVALMLALIPLFRMRLRDIGWRDPLWHFTGLVLVMLPVLDKMLHIVGTGLPWGSAFGIIQFVVLAILCMKASVPVPEKPLATSYDDPLPPR